MSAYSEDRLVEQPAIGLFAALGWQTLSAQEETFGIGGTLGRETRNEVVLVERLRAALCKFNPALPPEAISSAVDELTRNRSAMSLEAANCKVYGLLKEGITVSVPDRDTLTPGSSPFGRGGKPPNGCAWWIGNTRKITTSCWSASSAWWATSSPAAPIWSVSSMACPGW